MSNRIHIAIFITVLMVVYSCARAEMVEKVLTQGEVCEVKYARLNSSPKDILRRYRVYADDTTNSLEQMRNPETGLIRDKILLKPGPDGKMTIKVLNDNTSATNIGLDIINQISVAKAGPSKLAADNLNRTLTALEKMPYHKDSGLIFSWYHTTKDLQPSNWDVSSVDNIHLALALWTLKESFPGTKMGARAEKLFNRMDFSIFYDQPMGLMNGNLKFHKEEGNWTVDAYHFSNLGSEARSIYSLAYALGLVRNKTDPDFVAKAVAALKIEIRTSPDDDIEVLRTWDGGGFQQMLPDLLVSEGNYSKPLERSFKDYGRFIVQKGKDNNYPLPVGVSASNYGIDGEDTFKNIPAYQGKAGNPELMSTNHTDIDAPGAREMWDLVATPHAIVMAASTDPAKFAPILRKAERLKSGDDVLYQPGYGFMDGYHLRGPYKGRVVPVQISLDQGMIKMAVDKILSADGLSPSARALKNNPLVDQRLRLFFNALDPKLETTRLESIASQPARQTAPAAAAAPKIIPRQPASLLQPAPAAPPAPHP